MMNRAHKAKEARESLRYATQLFDNITIDLIYGIPDMDMKRWEQNIQIALEYKIPHISCYALTVEPQTALEKLIEKGHVSQPKDDLALSHFEFLIEKLEAEGFDHYELSNFGKPKYYSKNNTAYWLGKEYIGIGPSAHSFIQGERSWNISHNIKYIKALQENQLPSEKEKLSVEDRYNEYIMTGLRTIWGVSLETIQNSFGDQYVTYVLEQSKEYLENEMLLLENKTLTITKKGKFLSDGIASDLFYIE